MAYETQPPNKPLTPVQDRPLVVAISGASGALYGIKALETLYRMGVPTHLVISPAGTRTLKEETGKSLDDIAGLASTVHPVKDIGASIASGSFLSRGMLVAPCSVKTMSEIATGVTSSLIPRAADVMLKERRPLVLMVRETPFHLGHLRTMTALTEMGAIIAPPLPAFYNKPTDLDAMVQYSVDRVLDLFGLNQDIPRWVGSAPTVEG